MKFYNAVKYRLLAILASIVAVSCGYNDFEDTPPEYPFVTNPNTRISKLRDKLSQVPLEIKGDPIIISGYVTTSDKAGNFYRSFMIEDNSGAVEIKAGLYDMHSRYRMGQVVTVKLNDLTLGVNEGVMQIGAKSYTPNLNQTEFIGLQSILDRHVFRSDQIIEPKGAVMKISELNEYALGRLICIDNLKLDSNADTTWAVSAAYGYNGIPQTGLHKFKSNDAGRVDSIYVSTSGYASFANAKIPHGKISVRGILSRVSVSRKTCYQLKIRDLGDVGVN